MAKTEHVKVVFELPEEQEGYPPVGSERLWAVPQSEGNSFRVDNIPFYARGVSSGDVVRATLNQEGELIFQEVVKPSGNSTFRLYVFDRAQVQQIRDDLRAMGCPSELSDIPNLIAVEVPASQPIDQFLDYIVQADETGSLEYQEAALRHTLP